MSKIWLDGELVNKEDAKVSVFDHGLLYGDGCFEGIRAYNGSVFKLDEHLDRMYNSAALIRLQPAFTRDEIAQAIYDSISANGLSDAYIRLVFSRGTGTLGLNPFLCPVPTTFIIADHIKLYPDELYENGMKVIVSERPRIPIKALDPALKSLNYLNNILAKIEAIDAEVLEAVMLNMDGYVGECTGDNIFIVKDGVIVTPDMQAGILHGITRQFVINELGPSLGFNVDEKMFKLDELLAADEMFLTGTAAEIIGVTQVGENLIGDGTVGPVTKKLVNAFREHTKQLVPQATM